MAESLSQELESTTVGIYRTAAVVKGGRRFSFAALVVVGDRNGRVGIGYGKAPGVPAAIEKAQKDARKGIVAVSLKDGTIAHPVNQRFGASIVRLVPAAPGTGVIAGATVRAVLELAGVKDCLTKAYGSTNQKNLCKATFAGLQALRTKEDIVALRGVEIEKTEVEEILEAGKRFAPQTASSEAPAAKGPVNVVGKGKGGQRGRGGRGGGGGRGRGGAPQAPAPAPATEAPAAEAPAPAAEAPAAEDKPAEGA
jgi:small subunit ribosomal protein S5